MRRGSATVHPLVVLAALVPMLAACELLLGAPGGGMTSMTAAPATVLTVATSSEAAPAPASPGAMPTADQLSSLPPR